MNTLDARFYKLKNTQFSKDQINAGYFKIWRLLKPSIYLKIAWEIITTIVIYSPGVSTYLNDVISTIRSKWDSLSITDQDNIVAALIHLNKRGKVEKHLYNPNE